MSDRTIEFEGVKGPAINGIAAMAVTTTTAGTDLSLATQLGAGIKKGKFITLVADAAVFFFFNTSDAGTVDETNTTAGNATRCFLLPANTPLRVLVPSGGYHFIRYKTATGTATLRAYISSMDMEGN